jgi:hypothetical protein
MGKEAGGGGGGGTKTHQLVLLLDCVAVRGTLRSVDDFLSKALGDGLDIPESSLTSLKIVK